MNPSVPGERGDYLWDRRGAVDPAVAELERLLAPQGWRDAPRGRGAAAGVTPLPAPVRLRRIRRPLWAAAAVIACAAIGMTLWYQHRLQWPDARPWQVAQLEGEVRVEGRSVATLDALPPGALLETGDGASLRLRAARIGEVIVGEGSRFRLVETASGRHRTELLQGALWARIWAPPGAFGVATPAGDVFDLGCEFVVQADVDGSGSLTVRSGWVQVDNAWRDVLVPEGARVEFGAGGKPGTPYDLGASDTFVAVLRELDAAGEPAAEDPRIRRLVDASRPRDAISLLGLLHAHPHLAEGPLFDRMEQIMPADARVTRAALRERGAHALSPWWNALPYPRMKRWWTQWPDAVSAREDAEVLLRQDLR